MIDAGYGASQARIIGLRADGKLLHTPMMGRGDFRCKPANAMFASQRHAPAGSVTTGLKTLYDQDFVAWSKQQAEDLRAVVRGGSNQQLDWENLAEETESLGKSQRPAVSS